MSIKNIIQQENDLQEMSTQSLANYLNNPTGQYNPYLVAGELQRKEAFAQRQMTEAPQGTVVDELVATAAPMGGMPMGGMPMPRPEEMVSESITETGIANLPAPNIGQNYAGGGIVGYEAGGDVSDELRALSFGSGLPIRYSEDNLPGESTFSIKRLFSDPSKLFMGEPEYNAGPTGDVIADFLYETNLIKQKEKAAELQKELAKENKESMEMHRQTRLAREALNASENKANSRAERDAYLALAMGGAKTMAGQSPFALTNIGEGLGAGIGALSQSDANERARVDAQRTAYEKYMYDMNANQRLSGKEYADLITDIQASADYRNLLEQKAEEKNIDIDDPKYQVLIQETIRELLPLYGNSGASNSTTVNGKPFSRV
jgi:hypothetical protein